MNLLSDREIDDLYQEEVAKFRARIPQSLALHERGKVHMPNGVPMTWMVGLYDHPPIFMAKGEGAYLVDVDGNRYLDMNHADMRIHADASRPANRQMAGPRPEGIQAKDLNSAKI